MCTQQNQTTEPLRNHARSYICNVFVTFFCPQKEANAPFNTIEDSGINTKFVNAVYDALLHTVRNKVLHITGHASRPSETQEVILFVFVVVL